jgi:Fic family protein
MPFTPKFTITPKIAGCLMRIEAAKQAMEDLPITPSVLATLRETARLFSTHYSTMIEGNLLTQEQVSKVIEAKQHFPGRERDEKEVLGYYTGLEKLEQLSASQSSITETHIQTLHALVMAEGRKKVKPTPYRDGQNVIEDSHNRGIVYMPPEAKDVPKLMMEMVAWVAASERQE